MLDQAIQACSPYDGIDDAIEKFLAVIKSADSRDAAYTACGIDTTNSDTGGITGLDAGGSVAKTDDTTVLEIGNLYQSVIDHSQIIYTGDNGWLVKASAQDDSIISGGEDSIDAGAGDDFIKIGGRTATIVTGKNNDTISVESGVKSFTIKDFGATTSLIGAEGYESISVANGDGTSVVSFTKGGTSGNNSGDAAEIIGEEEIISFTESNVEPASGGNMADDMPPEEDSTTTQQQTTNFEISADLISGDGATGDEPYTIDLSTVNTLSGYFVGGNSSFQSGTAPSNATGIVSSSFDLSYLDDDGNGNLSFTYRGLKLNIKGQRVIGTSSTFVEDGAINSSNIASLNDTTSAKYYQWVIISGLYKWWLKEALDLNDEATGLNFYDGGATVNEIDLYFEDNQDSSWLAYVSRSSSNGKATHLDLVVNAKYFSGLDSDTDPNCDGYIDSGNGYRVGGRLDRTIAHEFNHAVLGANVDYFGNLPMFIKEGMAELIHGVDDKRKTPMEELLDNAINQNSSTTTYLDSWVNLNLNNSTQESSISGGASKGSYSYAGGYMFLRWLAKTSAEADTVPVGEITARVELRTDGVYYVSVAKDGTTNYERIASIGTGGDNLVSVGSAEGNLYTANGAVKQSITYGGGAWTVTGIGKNSSVFADSETEGNDSISFAASEVYVEAGAGADVVSISSGSDNTINTGAGDDSVYTADGDHQSINLGDGNNFVSLGTKQYTYPAETEGYVYNRQENFGSTITGGSGSDTVQGTSNGRYHEILIDTGDGDDYIALYGTNNTINAGDGDDSLGTDNNPGNVNNFLDAGAGNDKITVGAGSNSTFLGGAGNDSISFLNFGTDTVITDNYIDAGEGDDKITVYGSNNTIISGAGTDTVYNNSGAGNYFVFNNDNFGDDIIQNFQSADKISLAADFDYSVSVRSVNYTGGGTGTWQIITVTKNNATVGTITVKDPTSFDAATNIIQEEDPNNPIINNTAEDTLITGTELDDTITNSGLNVTIAALGGNDSIVNGGSQVSINAGTGDNTINVTGGDNITIDAGEGANTISVSAGVTASTIENFGADDQIILEDPTKANEIYIAESVNSSWSLKSSADNSYIYVEQKLYGKLEGNTITLAESIGPAQIEINGLAASDKITFSGEELHFNADSFAGNEISVVNNGGKSIYLDSGDGTAKTFTGSDATDTINNSMSGIIIDGGAGDGSDRIDNSGSNVTIEGGAGNDYIFNDNGYSIKIFGGEGSDTVYNTASDTTINGGAGDDSVYTSKDNVSINTADGDDTIKIYSGVTSFSVGGFGAGDVIQLAGAVSSLNVDGDSLIAGNVTIAGINSVSTLENSLSATADGVVYQSTKTAGAKISGNTIIYDATTSNENLFTITGLTSTVGVSVNGNKVILSAEALNGVTDPISISGGDYELDISEGKASVYAAGWNDLGNGTFAYHVTAGNTAG